VVSTLKGGGPLFGVRASPWMGMRAVAVPAAPQTSTPQLALMPRKVVLKSKGVLPGSVRVALVLYSKIHNCSTCQRGKLVYVAALRYSQHHAHHIDNRWTVCPANFSLPRATGAHNVNLVIFYSNPQLHNNLEDTFKWPPCNTVLLLRKWPPCKALMTVHPCSS
jgi:hypothetical protein